MRCTHMGAGIVLALGALGLHAPVAAAADGPDIWIDPGNASPGSTVTVVTGACDPDADYGKGWSEVGGEFHLFGDRKGLLTGRFKIPEGTKPGNDTITLKCPPRTKVTETYRVVGRPPYGSVRAGFGPADDTDMSTKLALSGGLLATAAAGSMVWMRRRPHGNRV